MEILNTLPIAIALAMDAFSVSITGGAILKKVKPKDALLVGIYFGVFQCIMTLLGWKGGVFSSKLFNTLDHWIAFGLLALIGGKMIAESFKKEEKKSFSLSHKLLIILAVATSIDALGTGFSYALLSKTILTPSIVIGITAFAFSAFGMYLGKILKKILKNKAELAGGIILIGIGINILIEHGIFY